MRSVGFARWSEKTVASTSSTSLKSPSSTSAYSSTTRSTIAWNTAPGPRSMRIWSFSRSSRSPLSGTGLPWRIVTTNFGPTTSMSSPICTRSVSSTYSAVFITSAMRPSWTSSFGRWWAWIASSTSSGCRPNWAPSASTAAGSGSCRPIHTNPSSARCARSIASVSGTTPPVRRPWS